MQTNTPGTSAKARLLARSGLRPCNETIWENEQYGKTSCNETIQAPPPRLGLSPGPAHGAAQWENNLQGKIQFAKAVYVGPLHPTLLPKLYAAPQHSNQQRCLQKKKVQGVLIGTVRSITKRLALQCIATPVLPLQRVFPLDDASETRQKIAFRPPPRPGDASFGAPSGPASGKRLGTAHCHPQCIENWAFEANIHRF